MFWKHYRTPCFYADISRDLFLSGRPFVYSNVRSVFLSITRGLTCHSFAIMFLKCNSHQEQFIFGLECLGELGIMTPDFMTIEVKSYSPLNIVCVLFLSSQ